MSALVADERALGFLEDIMDRISSSKNHQTSNTVSHKTHTRTKEKQYRRKIFDKKSNDKERRAQTKSHHDSKHNLKFPREELLLLAELLIYQRDKEQLLKDTLCKAKAKKEEREMENKRENEEIERERLRLIRGKCVHCGWAGCEDDCGMYYGMSIAPEPCDCCSRMCCICDNYSD